MNMCLLKVAMCEKCRSSHFQSESESKTFEDWEGRGRLKKLGLGGVTDLGRGLTPITPLHAMSIFIMYYVR